jgi:peptidyl-prolyl cis-trans isomerase A (cyclophilin A)
MVAAAANRIDFMGSLQGFARATRATVAEIRGRWAGGCSKAEKRAAWPASKREIGMGGSGSARYAAAMSIRIILAFLAAAAPVPAPAPAPAEDLVPVAIETSMGRIVVALDRKRAPKTVANFLAYVDGRKYNGETIYRAMKYGDGGLVQGGITSDARKLAKPVEFESSGVTGLKHVAGTISMAAAAPGSAQSDFFILTTDIPAFDADAAGQGFAAFGRVIEGMDVVKTILAAPVSATKGADVMKGQMLEPPVKIMTAARRNR